VADRGRRLPAVDSVGPVLAGRIVDRVGAATRFADRGGVAE
jgi:hypothetical protein